MSDTSTEDPSHRRDGFLAFFRKWQQTIVYMCIGAVVVFAIGLDRDNRADDLEALCVSGQDSRNVQRAFTEAIYELATSNVQEQNLPDRTLTPEEIERINRFIQDANTFRAEMYKKIKPSEICAPYVTDDNVKPPSPALPKLPDSFETEE